MTEHERSVDIEEFAELGEVYGMLKRDAKGMLNDLLDGVSLWRSTARILFGVALLAFLLVPLFVWGSYATQSPGDQTLSIGLGLIGVFMLGLGLVTLLSGLQYRRKYSALWNKYTGLYEAAKKLG